MKSLLCFFFIGILTVVNGSAQKTVKIDDMYYRIKDNNTVAIIGGNVKMTYFIIPSIVTINGKIYPVTEIANKNSDKGKLNKLQEQAWGNIVEVITVPSSVSIINHGAFYSQKSLKKIFLPETITFIGWLAFSQTGIREIDLSGTKISTLNMNCFNHCGLETLFLPQSLKEITSTNNTWASDHLLLSIDYKTLKNINNFFSQKIEKLIIRNSTKLEGRYSGLTHLSELTILAPVKEIGENCFNNVGRLKKVVLGNTLVKIDNSAFKNQDFLEEIQLPSSLTSIGSSAFEGCSSLKKIRIPPSITEIGDQAFRHCRILSEVKGLNSNIVYGSGIFEFSPLEETFKEIIWTFSYYALGVINKDLAKWKEKKEFETTTQWKARVTPEARDKRVKQLLEEVKQQYISNHSPKTIPEYTLGKFDADYNIYPIEFKGLGKQYVKVPLDEAPEFKANLTKARIQPTYGIKNDRLAIVSLSVKIGSKIYRNIIPSEDNTSEFLADLPPLEINFENNKESTQKNTINNDVDTNIPVTNTVADKTFAVVIANEAYTHEVKVPFALNDGEVFARYCQKTLGIPEKNIRLVKNATLNDMKFQLNWLAQVLTAYNGTAKAIVYYAGHGIPDEKHNSAYLLPADGYGSDPSTAYALQDFYTMLSNAQAQNITVFLDACFSGTKRENGMLASARGIAIKVRKEVPRGEMVIFTAAQGDETAYQYAEKGHGMFTYFLLKKLQESLGNTTLGELSDYIISEVKKSSIVNNNKSQTPTVIPSDGMIQRWKEVTLK